MIYNVDEVNENGDKTICVVEIADSGANGATARDGIADGIATGTKCELTHWAFHRIVVNDERNDLGARLLLIECI